MKVFHALDTMAWGRVFTVVGAVTVFWAALQKMLPEKYFNWGSAILAGTTAAVTLMMRSGKTPQEKAEDKIKEYEAEEKKLRNPEQK